VGAKVARLYGGTGGRSGFLLPNGAGFTDRDADVGKHGPIAGPSAILNLKNLKPHEPLEPLEPLERDMCVTFCPGGDVVWRRVALGVALTGLVIVPAHTRFVSAAADNRLQGVWRVVDQAGRPGAGVYIFTSRHYSMMVASTDRIARDSTLRRDAP
jgi:hypothetical protein